MIGRLICVTDSDYSVTLVNVLFGESVLVLEVVLLLILVLILSSFFRPILLFKIKYCIGVYHVICLVNEVTNMNIYL